MEEVQIREMCMDDITRPNNESTAKLAEILKSRKIQNDMQSKA